MSSGRQVREQAHEVGRRTAVRQKGALFRLLGHGYDGQPCHVAARTVGVVAACRRRSDPEIQFQAFVGRVQVRRDEASRAAGAFAGLRHFDVVTFAICVRICNRYLISHSSSCIHVVY